MDNKNLTIVAIVLLGSIAVLQLFTFLAPSRTPDIFVTVDIPESIVGDQLGGQFNANSIPSLTQTTTSTGSFGDGTIPVKLLDMNSARDYAIFCNDSNVPVYLTVTTSVLTVDGLGTTNGDAAATSSIAALDGIRLNANGGCYELLPENLVWGHVWATSTGGITKKAINISYKQ